MEGVAGPARANSSNVREPHLVTEVMGKIGRKRMLRFLLVTFLVLIATPRLRSVPVSLSSFPTSLPGTPAEQLYLQLRSVELDATRVYEIREAALDYPKVHITLDHGKIGFTTDVYGRVTGAFFAGDGELLVIPPDQAERASMTLFTGAAILEERFQTAYFRFNDDTFSALQPELRLSSEGKEFLEQWGESARNLAASDALRLFMTFSRCLPVGGQPSSGTVNCPFRPEDRFMHARVQGSTLGVFDVSYDSVAAEHVSVGQQKAHEGVNYYNVWAQFSVSSTGGRAEGQAPDEIGIRSYQIDVNVSPPTSLQATARVKAEVLRAGSRALLFELSRYLKVSTVMMQDKALEFIQNQALEGTQLARRGNDLVAVVFPEPLHTGQKMVLDFSYGGDVLSEAGGGLLYVGARGIWYPNRGMAAANFDLHFRYPAGWSLLATGRRLSSNENADELQSPTEKSSLWTTQVPIPIAGFNLGKYSRAEARAGDVTVETYAAAGMEHAFPKPPEQAVIVPPVAPGPPRTQGVPLPSPPLSPARHAQMVADEAASAIEFYSDRFGPYPYGTLRLTQMPGLLSQGWPSLIFLSSFSFLLPEETAHLQPDPVDAVLSQQVTAHETAHQWWGDLVYWRGYRDQWLSEGLANYCSLMMLETRDPGAFQRIMTRYRDNLLQKNKAGVLLKDAGPVTLGQRLSSSEFPDGYEAISYGRGTWLFHMLRHMLDNVPFEAPPRGGGGPGQDPFSRALHKLREHYAGKPVTTRQVLQELANELPSGARYEGKKQLDWFYEDWVNGTSVPHLRLQGVKFKEDGRTLSASGIILQRDAPNDLVTSVPIFAQLSDNRKVFVARIFADGPEATFHITVPAGTRRLLMDPDDTVLRN